MASPNLKVGTACRDGRGFPLVAERHAGRSLQEDAAAILRKAPSSVSFWKRQSFARFPSPCHPERSASGAELRAAPQAGSRGRTRLGFQVPGQSRTPVPTGRWGLVLTTSLRSGLDPFVASLLGFAPVPFAKLRLRAFRPPLRMTQGGDFCGMTQRAGLWRMAQRGGFGGMTRKGL